MGESDASEGLITEQDKEADEEARKSRLEEWEAKQKAKLENNKLKRRESGTEEEGDWAMVIDDIVANNPELKDTEDKKDIPLDFVVTDPVDSRKARGMQNVTEAPEWMSTKQKPNPKQDI
jgi:hypothetical protein